MIKNLSYVDELMARVGNLKKTLEYIASIAGAYCADDAIGKRFASIRDTALEMVGEDNDLQELIKISPEAIFGDIYLADCVRFIREQIEDAL